MKRDKYIFLIIITIILFVSACTTEKTKTVYSFDNTKIKYDVIGNGDVSLVFITGWGGNRKDWFNQIDYFSTKYKIITIDLAGFGESDNTRENWSMYNFGRDVASVVKKLDLDNIILIGFSMGGPVALETAQLIPDRIIGIIPIDVFHDVEFKISEKNFEMMIASFMKMVTQPTKENVSRLFSKEVESVLIERVITDWSTASLIGWEESLKNVIRYMYVTDELKNSLLNIDKPIRCINSDQQKINLDNALKYSNDFNIKIITNTGHIIMWEKPDEFNHVLSETILEIIEGSK